MKLGGSARCTQIDRFQIHWNAAEAVFRELDLVLTDASLIFTGKNYGSSVRYKDQHRQWAGTFGNIFGRSAELSRIPGSR